MVFLHGVNLFGFVWDNFARLLSKRGYRVLTFGELFHKHYINYHIVILCHHFDDIIII